MTMQILWHTTRNEERTVPGVGKNLLKLQQEKPF